jgi:virginiamycin B lyase
MARTLRGLTATSSAACAAFIGSLLLACGSEKNGSETTEGSGLESDPSSEQDGADSEAEGAPGGAGPSSSSESNMGLDGDTPLDPGGSEMPSGDQTPGDGEIPNAAETPLDELVVVEFPIPEDLPGCGPPFPHDPAVDEATGLIYYAGSNESCIGQFNPETGQFQAWPTATPDSYPHGLVVVDGRVYFTGIDQNLIGSVDPATGEAVDYPVSAVGPHTPTLHDGAVWFTAQRGGQFGRLDLTTGEADVFALSSANTGPYGIWPAPDGSLWIALFGTNRLARIDTAADPPSAEEFTLPQANSQPRRIAVDARGKVWFTDYPRRALGLLDPSLPAGEQVREFPTPGGGRPYGIAVGPDGRVWYNDQDASEIVGFDQTTESVVARLDLELENPGPVRNIAVDQQRRRLWLAISNVGRLAMIQF